MKLRIFISLSLIATAVTALDSDLITAFLKEINVKSTIIFDCFVRKKEHLETVKYFISEKLFTSVYNINNFNSSKPFLKENSKVTGVIINADCKSVTKLLSDIGSMELLYTSKHYWLVISTSKQTVNMFHNVNLDIATNLIVAIGSTEQKWTLFEVYNPSFVNGANLHINIVGNYSKLTGFEFNTFELKYFRRRDMKEIHFKSKIVLPAPFQGSLDAHLLSDDNRHVNTFPRFHNRLLQHCQEYYGYKLNISLSNSWGYKQSNGEFDGVMGAVIKKEIDFPVAPLALRADRLAAVKYGRHTWLLRSAFIFRDKKASVSMTTFFKPLALPVWILTILSVVLLSVVLKVAFHFEETLKMKPETSWSYVFLVTIAAFCQQGSYLTTSLFSARIVVTFSLILSLLIYQFYSGGIVSSLLMQPSTTIRTIIDIDSSGLKVGCEDIIYIRDFFSVPLPTQ